MYDIYGIVKVEYCSYNKGECFVSIGRVIILILPKCLKTRESKDEHCVSQCIEEQSNTYMTLYP